MKAIYVMASSLALAACSGGGTGGAVSHVALTVYGVSYQWPINDTTDFKDLGRPEQWKDIGYIPAGIWNEVMSPVPGMSRSGNHGQIAIPLHPALGGKWNIQPDGTGLPFLMGGHFEVIESGKGFTVGKAIGEGIVNPPVLVTFEGETQAYALCSAPRGPQVGGCQLMLNDRGVEHQLPLGWGNWGSAKAVLFFYRRLVGMPSNTVSK